MPVRASPRGAPRWTVKMSKGYVVIMAFLLVALVALVVVWWYARRVGPVGFGWDAATAKSQPAKAGATA